jgi:hypothetical protein
MRAIRLHNVMHDPVRWNSLSWTLRLPVANAIVQPVNIHNTFHSNRLLTVLVQSKYHVFSPSNYIQHLLKPISEVSCNYANNGVVISGISSLVNTALDTTIV